MVTGRSAARGPSAAPETFAASGPTLRGTVSLSELSQAHRRLARKGPSVGGASSAGTPGWDAPVTKKSRGRRSRTSQQVCPLRAVALRPAWREDLCSLACRRPGLVRIDHHGSWVAPVAMLPSIAHGPRMVGPHRSHKRSAAVPPHAPTGQTLVDAALLLGSSASTLARLSRPERGLAPIAPAWGIPLTIGCRRSSRG